MAKIICDQFVHLAKGKGKTKLQRCSKKAVAVVRCHDDVVRNFCNMHKGSGTFIRKISTADNI